MSIDLKNKVVLITGGSAGLGAAVARRMAAEGAHVAINYSNSEERANQLAQSLTKEFGIKAEIIKADAFDSSTGQYLVNETIKRFSRLDIVVSNAGWTKIVPYEDLESLDEELWDNCFQINVKTHFFLFKAAKKVFDANEEGGTFIVLSSVAGRKVYGSSIPYAVSKAALNHLVLMLAKSQGPKVRVHAVCPGLLMTDWGKRFPEEKVETTRNNSALNTLPDVDETASHYVFLSKLRTSTGTINAMDGGLLL